MGGEVIREATLVDVPELVALGKAFIATSEYRGRLVVNPTQMAATATRLIEQPDGVVFVSEDKGGAVTGMIGFVLFIHPLSGLLTAGEMFWFVLESARGVGDGVRLFRRAKQWAIDSGADMWQMVAPNERVATFYEQEGMDRVETACQQTLRPVAARQEHVA